jgi:hypothetical protein
MLLKREKREEIKLKLLHHNRSAFYGIVETGVGHQGSAIGKTL